MRNTLKIGDLEIIFHRTIKVPLNEVSALPPSLGMFEINKVNEHCPERWDKNAYFIAMYDKEAMWMGFNTLEPKAVKINLNGINAVNGEQTISELKKDNYLVAPPQPWLDGWKNKNGTVYQFVATSETDLSVGSQLLDKIADEFIQIEIFDPKEKLPLQARTGGQGMCLCCCGVAKGGEIEQKIYEDPYGVEVWNEKPTASEKIYIINASQYSEITGIALPLPLKCEEYNGVWFHVDDQKMNDVAGTDAFDKLKSI
jgi:hypothetical protein